MAVPVVESAAGTDQEGPASDERVTRVRVEPGLETLASRSLAQESVSGRKNRVCAPIPDLDTSTPLGRACAARSSGFPVENLFEPDAGAVRRTSSANPFEYVLRCCGPKRAGGLVQRAEVERTAAEKASTRDHLGVSALRALGTSACARMTGWPRVVTGPGLPQTRTCSH